MHTPCCHQLLTCAQNGYQNQILELLECGVDIEFGDGVRFPVYLFSLSSRAKVIMSGNPSLF